MPKFLFAYHGGKQPATPEEGQKAMDAWNQWFEGLGVSVIDGGNPVGKSTTVSASGVADHGGANPVSGYSIIEAKDLATAVKHARKCPILPEGNVEVAPIVEM